MVKQRIFFKSFCKWAPVCGGWVRRDTVACQQVSPSPLSKGETEFKGVENSRVVLSRSKCVTADIQLGGVWRDFFNGIVHRELRLLSFKYSSAGAATPHILLVCLPSVWKAESRAACRQLWERAALWWQRSVTLSHRSA